MRRFLYEIDEKFNGWAVHDQRFPFMPRVLAEKTAKQANRNAQKYRVHNYAMAHKSKDVKAVVSKTHIVTKDGTPRGQESWETWVDRKRSKKGA